MKTFTGALVLSMIVGITPVPARADGALGTWIMDNGKVTVDIKQCGDALCGTIVAMKKPLDKYGMAKRDKWNPNPDLRDRPVIGLTILSNVRSDGEDHWKGDIYNPDDGHIYNSYMKLLGDSMKVKGCFTVVCKDIVFDRIN